MDRPSGKSAQRQSVTASAVTRDRDSKLPVRPECGASRVAAGPDGLSERTATRGRRDDATRRAVCTGRRRLSTGGRTTEPCRLNRVIAFARKGSRGLRGAYRRSGRRCVRDCVGDIPEVSARGVSHRSRLIFRGIDCRTRLGVRSGGGAVSNGACCDSRSCRADGRFVRRRHSEARDEQSHGDSFAVRRPSPRDRVPWLS
jgi:hypothetical protein